MSDPALLTIQQIVLRALHGRKGSLKVHAALGELMAADAMVNLCTFLGLEVEDSASPDERERVSRVDYRVVVEVNAAWSTFEAAEDNIAASRMLVPVLRAAAAELRGIVKHVDFYDDDA